MSEQNPILSIVTPAFNEAGNLPLFHERLVASLSKTGIFWEWVVVDDHSQDATFQILQNLIAKDSRIQAVRLTRNFGSHAAISCGLGYTRGKIIAVLGADLQDPPELLPHLFHRWQEGFPIVWAVRRDQKRDRRLGNRLLSHLYYLILQKITGLKEIPLSGADFFLMDRLVLKNLNQFPESHNDLFMLIHWMGFPHATIEYDKEERVQGTSGWTLQKKITLFVDAVTAFTDIPLRWISWVGGITASLGFFYAGFILLNALMGKPPQGWSSLMIAILLSSGIQMLLIGIIGQYVWRALSEAKRRPRFIVEETFPKSAYPHETLREHLK